MGDATTWRCGHPKTIENTYHEFSRNRPYKTCLLCRVESQKRYRQSEQGHNVAKKWSQTEKGRAKIKRRVLSAAFKKSKFRYRHSEKGKRAEQVRAARTVRVRIGGDLVRVATTRTIEEATQLRAFVFQQMKSFRLAQKERQNVTGTIRTAGKETSSVSPSADSTEAELRKN